MEQITCETDGGQYGDIRVNGVPVASVDLKDDGTKRVRVYNPDNPDDAVAEYDF